MSTRRRGAALRVGLVCPYSFEAPGGVQNHVLGLADHLLQQGHEPYVLAPGTLDGLAPGTIAERTLHLSRYRRPGALQRLGGPGQLRPAECRPEWPAGCGPAGSTCCTSTNPSRRASRCSPCGRPSCRWSRPSTPRPRGPAPCRSPAECCARRSRRSTPGSRCPSRLGMWSCGTSAGMRWSSPTGSAVPTSSVTTTPARRSVGRRMVFLGRVDEPRKGLDVLVAAAAAIRLAVPDLEIVVAGQGNRPLPTGLVDAGVVTDEEKAALLATADCFVAPHRARESFGIVVLEAMASGTPVLASDIDRLLRPVAHRPGRPSARRAFHRGRSDGACRGGDPAVEPSRPAAGGGRPTGRPALRLVAGRGSDPRGLRRRSGSRGTGPGPGRRIMIIWSIVSVVVIVLLIIGWRLSWLATRVDRANARTESTWAALDAALVRRAQRAAELSTAPGIDPASALLISDAAAAALEPDLSHDDRERAESDLSRVLEVVAPAMSEIVGEWERANSESATAQRCGQHRPGPPPPPHRQDLSTGRTRRRAAAIRDG